MRLYAELPRRRGRQITVDLAVLCWSAAWIWVATKVHAAIGSLQSVTDQVTAKSTGLRQSLAGAADEARKIPFAGKALGDRIADAATAAQSFADAGTSGGRTIGQVALITALVVSLGAIVPTVIVWLWFRLRWVRRAAAALRLRAEPEGLDLLALRAVATASLRRVRAVAVDPAGGWRSGDAGTVAALAGLELAALGLRPRPREATGAGERTS